MSNTAVQANLELYSNNVLAVAEVEKHTHV